jgi:hypothetical protein
MSSLRIKLYFLFNISFTSCWSYLGKVTDNGAQDLSLENPGCVYEGTAIHELLHALGHVHEHNRPDRDEWVRINWGNISPGIF